MDYNTYFNFFVLPLGVLVFILVLLVLYVIRNEERHKKKFQKLMRTHVSNRVRQEKIFKEQLERLEAQFRSKSINKETYARFRKILEINLAQRREEARKQLGARV